jgi:hypothetical protein
MGFLEEKGVLLWCFDGGGVVNHVVKMVRKTSLLGAQSSATVCGFILGVFFFESWMIFRDFWVMSG